MFIDPSVDPLTIAKNTGFSIFVGNFDQNLGPDLQKSFPPSRTYILKPDEKTAKISVEMVRDFFASSTRESSDVFYLVISPESMNSEAQNAILKNLEEPKEYYHYVFFTAKPTSLLPTILSRANIYYQRLTHTLDSPVTADEKIKTYAKRLLTAKPTDLSTLAKEISDKKDRNLALQIVETAIEMSVKSYFKTRSPAFLRKLDNLITLHGNISANGHIKLHFVADMI